MGFICTTNDRDFGPTRSRSGWEMLSSSLRKELGPEFELLLAKPVPHDGKIDWYVDLDAAAVPIAALDASNRAALLARLEGMRRQVLAYADRLAAANSRGKSPGMAQDLREAMHVPGGRDNQYVWSAEGHPVLVAWGLEPPLLRSDEGAPSEVGKLGGYRPNEDPVEPARLEQVSVPAGVPDQPNRQIVPPVVPATKAGAGVLVRFPWALPLWVLFIALVGASYFLLLQGCAFSWNGAGAWLARFLPSACEAGALPPVLTAERERRDFLITRIRDAELEVARTKASCSARGDSKPLQPDQKQACNELQKRLRENQAQIGKLEITLQWNGLEDLDLRVDCPGGHARAGREGDCGSIGDVDWNYAGKDTDHPIEHILWKEDPPAGRYDVLVEYYSPKGPDHPVSYDIFVKRNGAVEGPFHGTVRYKGDLARPHSFSIGPAETAPPALQCDAG